MTAKIGRPTKLTPQVQKKIIDLVRNEAPYEVAAAVSDICEKTLYNWLELGEKGREPYITFLQELKRASGECELNVLRDIRAGGQGWQSRAWLAERKWPKRYGRTVRVDVCELDKQIETGLEKLATIRESGTVKSD